MRLGPIALKLRLADTRFENKVAGAAELAFALQDGASLREEMAFVIQISETVAANTLDSGINQKITERFGIIVMLNNALSDKDKTGLTAYDSLYEVRQELFKALLGWQVTGTESLVSYGGGRLLGINRAQMWYQFEFETTDRVDDDDGVDVGASSLDSFDEIYAQWAIDGPDGKKFAEWHEFGFEREFGAGFAERFDSRLYPPNMETVVDFTDDPKDGSFGKGFGIPFKVTEH